MFLAIHFCSLGLELVLEDSLNDFFGLRGMLYCADVDFYPN